MSTHTERVFAAFQGPVLSVDTAVVHMYRTYTAELLLPRRWRLAHGLGAADVLAALQHATVRAGPSLSLPPLRCEVCGGVVALASPCVHQGMLPDDLESYCATLRSLCTSSRKHLRCSTLVLAVELCGALVCSQQFAVFARRPGRQTKSRPPNEPRLSAEIPPMSFMILPGVAETLIARVPGFVLQKSSVTCKLAVCIRAYTSVESAAMGRDVAIKYVRNVIPNVIQRDASTFGQPLAVIANW
eukprot:m51a1_g6599 hypothetical protein (243) ;mRNA; f:311234-312399